MGAFGHRSLRVYQLSVAFVQLAFDATARTPRRYWRLSDQLTRAASSIALNIAEGAGEFSAGDKARFYRIARRSAAESITAIDLLRHRNAISYEDAISAEKLLSEIAAILTTMIKNQEQRSRRR